MISHLLNSLLIGILYADLLERRFPEQFRAILTDLTFNALYLFSKAQIYFVRLNRNFNEFVKLNPTLLKIKTDLDNLIKPTGEVITMSEFIKNGERLSLEEANASDIALFSWLGQDKQCIIKKIIYDINEPMTMADFSDIKFMLVELCIGENKYKVDLKTDHYNFYLVGNKFTKQFFLYYLKQCIKIYEPINKDDKFTLKIIDHNVNSLAINFTDKNESIILEKNGYKIVNNDE
jgi:hypothetical protein